MSAAVAAAVGAAPEVAGRARRAVRALAGLEARRMLRHPAPWVGIVLSLWWVSTTGDDWNSAQYQGFVVAFTPLWLGISLAAAGTFARGALVVGEDAPVGDQQRTVARLLAGSVLVALAAAVVIAAEVALVVSGGIRLGDEPGRTDQALHTAPEVLQGVVLAAFAVPLGAVVVRLVRHLAAAWVVLVVFWFGAGATYWVFGDGAGLRLAPIQVQPAVVEIGAWDADPLSFPSTWLLSAPGEYQDYWGRLVLSPWLAVGHDLYLLGLTSGLVAVLLRGRSRRAALLVAAVLVVAGLGLQWAVAP